MSYYRRLSCFNMYPFSRWTHVIATYTYVTKLLFRLFVGAVSGKHYNELPCLCVFLSTASVSTLHCGTTSSMCERMGVVHTIDLFTTFELPRYKHYTPYSDRMGSESTHKLKGFYMIQGVTLVHVLCSFELFPIGCIGLMNTAAGSSWVTSNFHSTKSKDAHQHYIASWY